jgi:hypothetical protein
MQLYPESAEQLELITTIALRCGFSGGLVVDYPNSRKARKHYLCLFAGLDAARPLPSALGTAAAEAGGGSAGAGDAGAGSGALAPPTAISFAGRVSASDKVLGWASAWRRCVGWMGGGRHCDSFWGGVWFGGGGGPNM